jgi:hypothetical protein
MSLFGLVKQAIEGQATWSDVGQKIESLFTTDVVSPLEAFGEQFISDFGKASLTIAGTFVPQLLSGTLTIATAIPQVAAQLEQQAVSIAETDALQDANTVIGNALRVQLTAAQVTAATTPATPVPAAPEPAPAA